jgi:predicted RNase H-like HicB family nuclease
MKVLKNIVLCLFMAVSVAGVSTTAVAESDAGRVTYKQAEAIDNVVAKIKEAQGAIAAGKTDAEVLALVKAAKDLGKEINANDRVDRARAKATQHIAKAIGYLKEKDQKVANEHLSAAIPDFEALKSLI